MKILAFIVSLLFLIRVEKPYNIYCNARFNYCINYPGFLIPQPESENGDGKVFKNKNGETILTVFGTLNQDTNGDVMTLKMQFDLDIDVLVSAHSIISYKKIGKTYYVISGLKYGKIFYRKVLLKDESFCFATLDYEQSERETYDSLSVDIFKSFK